MRCKHQAKRILPLLLLSVVTASVLFAGGCAGTKNNQTGRKTTAENASAAADSAAGTEGIETSLDLSDMFTDRDMEQDYDADEAVPVELRDGATEEIKGVTVDSDTDTVTITAAGVYVLSGTLSDGQIVVDAGDSDKVQIVLSNASVTKTGSAAVYVKNADKVFLTTAEGTENTLASKGTFDADGDTNIDGTVFAKDTIVLNGRGALTVTSEAGHGIVSKDTLKVTGGILTVDAAEKGLAGKDSVRIGGGTIDITAGDDGIHSANDDDDSLGWTYIGDGEVTIASGDDGIHADSELYIAGGSVVVTKSYEGLESKVLSIAGGTIDVTAEDDGFNAASAADTDRNEDPMAGDDSCVLTIAGGEIRVNAGGDGLDSNGVLAVTGGTTYVSGPTDSANGALDSGTNAYITGGTVIAAGSAGMAENFGSDSTQGSIMVSFDTAVTGTVTLSDADGNKMLSWTPEKEYSNVVISTAGIVDGGTYTVTAGDAAEEVTMDGLIYGEGNGFGGPGGGPGGPGGSDGGERRGTPPEDGDGTMTRPEGGQEGGTPPERPENDADGSTEEGSTDSTASL